MKSTPSPRVRFLAVLALILVAGGGAFLLLRGTNTSNSSADGSTLTRTTHTTTPTTSQTTTTRKPHKKPKVKPLAPGGTVALDAALVAHPVVVVSVYSPSVATDITAMKEAKAGAAAGDAGFTTFNVYDETQARQLTRLLGTDTKVSNPAVLIFKRPRTLAFELLGFADSQVVAQAAENVHPREEPWMSEANGICARYATLIDQAGSASVSTSGGFADLVTGGSTPKYLDQIAKLINAEVRALSVVRVNVSKAASYKTFISDFRQTAALVSAYAKAVDSGDQANAQAIRTRLKPLVESIDALVPKLHLTSCVA